MKTNVTYSPETRALISLHHLHGGDSVRLWPLLKTHGSAQGALQARGGQLALPLAGVPQTKARENPLEALERLNARAVSWLDEDYPALLAREEHSPPIFYMQGNLVPEDACAVAIVGSRRATRWARRLAYELARDLAAVGVTIVSGLAAGVDAAAHEGALETGRTIAVVGSGLDRTYPAHHKKLAERIARRGAVISQFPCGAPPLRHHFPQRNVTIVGLSLGVVVVEAPKNSGAILTAKIALDHNVELMVCPGDAGRPSCAGSNGLLKIKGTAMVESAEDVLEALRLEEPSLLRRAAYVQKGMQVPSWIDGTPASIDDLVERSGLHVGQVRAQLTELELAGLVMRLEGDRYCLVSDASVVVSQLHREESM